MTHELTAMLLDETLLRLDELASSCTVTREWVIEHVRAGVLLETAGPDPTGWAFTSRDLIRAKQLCSLERQFEDLPNVPFRDHVWPKFLRENALRVFKIGERLERMNAR